MKAIIENNNTYEVTGERGDFFIGTDNKGKSKMFAKHLVEVIEIESMPKAKVFKKITKGWSDAEHKQFKKQIAEAEFQEKYVESQRSFVKSNNLIKNF